MTEKVFINEAFTNAINIYMQYKMAGDNPVFSTFPVIVIRTLINIYGELDIINPYRTNNETRLGGFDNNIIKFGFPKEKLTEFKQLMQTFSETKDNGVKPNISFLKIEKYLIDMMMYKKKNGNVKDEEWNNFQTILYLSSNTNPIMKKELQKYLGDSQELDRYFTSKVFENEHQFALHLYKRNTLLPEAYTTLGYSLDSISKMDEDTLENLNHQIFNFFKIDINDQNKMNRLKEAITYYKKYGNSLTTGNGYVDILLLLSVIATAMMMLFAITVKVLG